MTQPPHRGRAFFSGVVLLQTALLLASIVMVPAPVVAQDPSAPASQQEGQPSAEASPEPSQAPAPEPSTEPGSEAVRRARTRAVGIARGEPDSRARRTRVAIAEPRWIAVDVARDIGIGRP